MELIDHYLEKVMKVHGIYVLRVDREECSDEQMQQIVDHWDLISDGHPLFVFPMAFTISFLEQYSLYIALMLVRGGHGITRNSWLEEHVGAVPCLILNDHGQIVKRTPGKEDEPLVITSEYLDAEDYVIIPRGS
ncbi:hypothetical protein C2I27_03910 [Priestia megaterium]|uniref:hypothetical protein n=1 Tax=Priestia megaterium TaxID=1404 RepID=UPI000D512F71|nr:hypothetical protein [Priestia megaterium]PVC75042.1 hypothetical protein C2I27_03910 [Priestia megaterium]